ncbi:type II toxin-antitoxin system PemK/MazF family toxin [Ligilactobacillus murinus]|nr:type II toxin-antitoxin system PemK/MazF family toxin [Ligilactobacillus murinus]
MIYMYQYKNINQGQILKVSLDPTKGHEQSGWRPALVVSNNEFNKYNGGIIKVVPITSNTKPFPLHLPLPYNLATSGVVELEHERALDLGTRSYKFVETVSEEFLEDVLDHIRLTY